MSVSCHHLLYEGPMFTFIVPVDTLSRCSVQTPHGHLLPASGVAAWGCSAKALPCRIRCCLPHSYTCRRECTRLCLCVFDFAASQTCRHQSQVASSFSIQEGYVPCRCVPAQADHVTVPMGRSSTAVQTSRPWQT